MDNPVFDKMCALRDCLEEQIKASGTPKLGFVEIVPGEAAAGDYFDCNRDGGMAWVRLQNSYRMVSIGTADTSLGNCGTATGFDVELGIMRCIKTSTMAPSVRDLREATALQIMDMDTMVRAVACCDAVSGKDYVLGTYTPLGPQGGIVGGVLPLSMG